MQVRSVYISHYFVNFHSINECLLHIVVSPSCYSETKIRKFEFFEEKIKMLDSFLFHLGKILDKIRKQFKVIKTCLIYNFCQNHLLCILFRDRWFQVFFLSETWKVKLKSKKFPEYYGKSKKIIIIGPDFKNLIGFFGLNLFYQLQPFTLYQKPSSQNDSEVVSPS